MTMTITPIQTILPQNAQPHTTSSSSLPRHKLNPQLGFTLVEMMIVVAIIGVLAAFAYPNYQRYVIKSKRTDMMSEMSNIANQIESKKLAKGAYGDITTADLSPLVGDYPKQGVALYSVVITPTPLTSQWLITATPKTGLQMFPDGALTLNHQGIKCRAAVCSSGDDWNK